MMARCTGFRLDFSKSPSKSSNRRCLARNAIRTVVRYRLLDWRMRLSPRLARSLESKPDLITESNQVSLDSNGQKSSLNLKDQYSSHSVREKWFESIQTLAKQSSYKANEDSKYLRNSLTTPRYSTSKNSIKCFQSYD